MVPRNRASEQSVLNVLILHDALGNETVTSCSDRKPSWNAVERGLEIIPHEEFLDGVHYLCEVHAYVCTDKSYQTQCLWNTTTLKYRKNIKLWQLAWCREWSASGSGMLNRNKRFASKLAGSVSPSPSLTLCSTSPNPGVNHASFSTPKSVRIEHTLSAVKCILAIFWRTNKLTARHETQTHTWIHGSKVKCKIKSKQKPLACRCGTRSLSKVKVCTNFSSFCPALAALEPMHCIGSSLFWILVSLWVLPYQTMSACVTRKSRPNCGDASHLRCNTHGVCLSDDLEKIVSRAYSIVTKSSVILMSYRRDGDGRRIASKLTWRWLRSLLESAICKLLLAALNTAHQVTPPAMQCNGM